MIIPKHPFWHLVETDSLPEELADLLVDVMPGKQQMEEGYTYFEIDDGESGLGITTKLTDRMYPEVLMQIWNDGKGDHDYYKQDEKGRRIEFVLTPDEAIALGWQLIEIALVVHQRDKARTAKHQLKKWNDAAKKTGEK